MFFFHFAYYYTCYILHVHVCELIFEQYSAQASIIVSSLLEPAQRVAYCLVLELRRKIYMD